MYNVNLHELMTQNKQNKAQVNRLYIYRVAYCIMRYNVPDRLHALM